MEDIPEELQATYAMYVINYARYGEEPHFDDWRDQRMWNLTKQRMDEETTKYEKKCRNLRHQFQEEEPAESEEPADTEADTKPKRKRFEKPTVEEVAEYCQERNNGIQAQHFIDFYESKGWKVGQNPMKDWKACIRTWEQRSTSPPDRTQRKLPEDRLTL